MEPEGQPDPFEHFAEQEISWSAVQKHTVHLVALARRCFAASPAEPIGALILCAGAPLAKAMAQAMPPEARPDPDLHDCITGMPRTDFDAFVRLHMPEGVDSLPEADPAWREKGRTLPILVATAHGHRLASVTYDIE